jgi:hypothetical protein
VFYVEEGGRSNSAVVCTGDVGRVVSVDEDGISELDETLVDHFSAWLDDALHRVRSDLRH